MRSLSTLYALLQFKKIKIYTCDCQVSIEYIQQ